MSTTIKKVTIPDPSVGQGKKARAVVDISDHKLYLYDVEGRLTDTYNVATGKTATPTLPGLRVVDGKLNQQDTARLGVNLWGSAKTFGTRLLNLTHFDLKKGKRFDLRGNGHELHGTYANDSIGKNASHGCVRMYNKDIETIYSTLKNGDLVDIRP
jgi:lipoprotein-anchoring transpeptidase ErfK/SrfK